MLRRLHGQGTTVVVIEQRVSPMLTDVTRCVVMDEGEIRFDGSPKASDAALRAQHLLPRYPERPVFKREPEFRTQRGEPLLRLQNVHYEMDHKPISS